MKHLIVNADDFGLSDSRDEAIKKLLQDKLITSTSVMINQKNTEKVIRYINENKLRCCGLHLTLSTGYSVYDHTIKLRLDLDRKINYFNSMAQYNFYKKEVETQINVAVKLWKVTHLDGHLHIQTYPIFYEIITESMHAYNLYKMRNTFSDINNKLSIKGLFKQNYRNYMKKKNIIMPDYFYTLSSFMKNIDYILSLPDKSVIEVACHPDITGNDDYEMLMSSEYKNTITKFENISYNEFR